MTEAGPGGPAAGRVPGDEVAATGASGRRERGSEAPGREVPLIEVPQIEVPQIEVFITDALLDALARGEPVPRDAAAQLLAALVADVTSDPRTPGRVSSVPRCR